MADDRRELALGDGWQTGSIRRMPWREQKRKAFREWQYGAYRMTDMKKRLIDNIKRYNMIAFGDSVCVGLSGGVDSVCLFVLLNEIKEDMGFSLSAFHVNHNLRGSDSIRDRDHAAGLCEKYNVPLYIFEHDIAAEAAEMKCGTEEAGRIARRKDAAECINNGASKIALAHHLNDQAETVLFNLSRGSSISGMCGIRPVNGYFIHPLLIFEKKEIIAELEKRNISWCTDATNADTGYTRNCIRHEVIPLMEDKINAQTSVHLSAAAGDLQLAAELIDGVSRDAYDKYVKEISIIGNSDNASLSADGLTELRISADLKEQNRLVQLNVFKLSLARLSGKNKDIDRKHLEQMADLMSAGSGSETDLPYGICAVKSYDGLTVKHRNTECPSEFETDFIPGKTTAAGPFEIRSRIIDAPRPEDIEKNKYTKVFDYDIIKKNCILRTRRPGDRMVIDSSGRTKKLKDILIDEKIEKGIRDRLILLADGSLVHWIIGYRMGESAKITDATIKAVQISVNGEY